MAENYDLMNDLMSLGLHRLWKSFAAERAGVRPGDRVLDVAAGSLKLPSGFPPGAPVERPAMALLLRPDGSVVVRNEVDDAVNEVRKDIENNYKHELSLSSKKRENSQGMGYQGMMSGMGGMMQMMMGGGGRR